MKRNDNRARQHSSYWAFAVHRVSGILLAVFIPLHFWVLSLALKGEAALNGFLVFTDTPAFRFGEWALVILLTLHLMGGVRLLLIAFRPASPSTLRKGWIAGAVGVAVMAGLAFILSLAA